MSNRYDDSAAVAIEDALDALEGMVEQYLYCDDQGRYDHACMSAGEFATDVLLRLRPNVWEEAPRGLRRRDIGSTPGAPMDDIRLAEVLADIVDALDALLEDMNDNGLIAANGAWSAIERARFALTMNDPEGPS